MARTLSKAIEETCRRNASNIAIYANTGEAIRYDDYFGCVLAFAEIVNSLGIKQGQCVSYRIADETVISILRLALLRLGVIAIEGSAKILREKYSVQVDHYFYDEPTFSDDTVNSTRVDNGWLRPPTKISPIYPDGKLVFASSGTTGLPKLRVFDDEQLHARAGWSDKLRWIPSGNVFVGYRSAAFPAFTRMTRTFAAGLSVVQPRADWEKSLAAISKYDATDLYLSGFQYLKLLETMVATRARLPNLRIVAVGGSPISYSVASLGEEVFNCPVINTYGSSETGGISHCRTTDYPDEAGCVGHPYKNIECKLADITQELLIRPPRQLVPRNFPEMSEVADSDGWIHTGDIGTFKADGTLYITGRLSELINSGGNKYSPTEFEETARRFDGVKDVTAFAVNSPNGDQIAGVAIKADPDFDIHLFSAGMQDRFGKTCMMQIAVVHDFVYSKSGKIDRNAMSDMFGKALENQSGQ